MSHGTLVLTWLSGMHFHGAYFSNYSAWIKSPTAVLPSTQSVWDVVGQDILNSDVGAYQQGLYLTSGLFSMWRASGIVHCAQLKLIAITLQIIAILLLLAAYLHMKVIVYPNSGAFFKLRTISLHHIVLLSGLASLCWSGHLVHISIPTSRLLDSGVDSSMIPAAADLLSTNLIASIYPTFGTSVYPEFAWSLPQGVSLLADAGTLDSNTGSIHLGVIAAHHFFLAVCLIVAGSAIRPNLVQFKALSLLYTGGNRRLLSHLVLSVSLAITGSLSIITSHHLTSMLAYPFLGADYPTVLCSFVHHMWIGSILTVGAGAHGSIHLVRDHHTARQSCSRTTTIAIIIGQRELIIGHLVWVTIFLGTHAFGLYIHNDTLQSLGRPEDLISDNGILMKPIFANSIWSLRDEGSNQYINVMDSRIVTSWQELGTSDFLVHHIHAFTIHVTLLILVKGVLTSRSSRLVSDKSTLGFRFPCDGPGRGGTCQISPWDHIFLSLFWSYNTIAVVVFHYYWKVQSDIWGVYESTTMSISHVTGGDFSSTSMTINAWLTNFLWSQASQVIQSYGTSNAGYGLIFLAAHFVWALSLMFLYSGRGYWQELIESILWSHNKLHFSPEIQVRALSITQGRAVGLTHYLLGAISVTWSFILSRTIALTT
jgi:photosystem I P700 chlorophyll a apoprotein A1